MQIVLKDIKERKMQSLAYPVRSELRQTTLNIHITFLKQWMACCRGGIKADTWILTKCPQFCRYSMYLLNERKNHWSESREQTTVQWLRSLSSLCSVTWSCLTLCDPIDCSPPGSSVRGIFLVRILEWVAISFLRGSSWPRDWTWVSCTGKWILYYSATWEALCSLLVKG